MPLKETCWMAFKNYFQTSKDRFLSLEVNLFDVESNFLG